MRAGRKGRQCNDLGNGGGNDDEINDGIATTSVRANRNALRTTSQATNPFLCIMLRRVNLSLIRHTIPSPILLPFPASPSPSFSSTTKPFCHARMSPRAYPALLPPVPIEVADVDGTRAFALLCALAATAAAAVPRAREDEEERLRR